MVLNVGIEHAWALRWRSLAKRRDKSNAEVTGKASRTILDDPVYEVIRTSIYSYTDQFHGVVATICPHKTPHCRRRRRR